MGISGSFADVRSTCEVDLEAGVREFTVDPPVDTDPVLDLLVFLLLKALKNSTGKSATPMLRLAIVPNSAEAPPDIGSHGPPSVSYSRERYLNAHENCRYGVVLCIQNSQS